MFTCTEIKIIENKAMWSSLFIFYQLENRDFFLTYSQYQYLYVESIPVYFHYGYRQTVISSTFQICEMEMKKYLIDH